MTYLAKTLKTAVVAAAGSLAVLPAPALPQGVNQPIVAHGTCDAQSGVTINGQRSGPFACDMVAVTRTQRGSVIVQFTDRRGDDGRVLGFAGMIEGKQGFGADQLQIVVVERLYLAGGADPVSVTRGTCMLNWTGLYRDGGRLIAVVCGAYGQAEDTDIQGRAVLTVRGHQ